MSGVRTYVNSTEKFSSIRWLWGGWNPWCCVIQDSKPGPLPTELFWPPDVTLKSVLFSDKLLTSRPVTLPLDLKTLCQKLRASKESSDSKLVANPTKQWPEMPEAAINLLKQLLDPNPTTRITAEKALTHEFLSPSPESRTTASAAEWEKQKECHTYFTPDDFSGFTCCRLVGWLREKTF